MRRPRLRDLPFLLTLAAFAAWFVLLRPGSLGGPASYLRVSGTSMLPTIHDGDLAIVTAADAYVVGEVVAFRVPADEAGAGAMVIHRIVGGSPTTGFVTQGDNKPGPDLWRPKPADIVGTLRFVVPGAGPILGGLRQPAVFAAIGAGFTVFAVLLGGRTASSSSRSPLGSWPSGVGTEIAAGGDPLQPYRWTRARATAVFGPRARLARPAGEGA